MMVSLFDVMMMSLFDVMMVSLFDVMMMSCIDDVIFCIVYGIEASKTVGMRLGTW